MMKIPQFPILAAALLVTLPVRAQQNLGEMDGGLDINVRAGIDNAEKDKRDHDPAYGQDPTKRLRLFFLARVQEEKNGENLVKPVDAATIAKELTAQLKAQGFRPVQPNQKPEIVITAKYGRGMLSNPYARGGGGPQPTDLSTTPPLSVWTIYKHPVGLAEKQQRMLSYDKLIIQVRAWKYPPPPDPKQREVLLWMTTIYVDDPDHRDLNVIAAKMLATGAPYFDHHIDRENEVLANTALPEGHVKVGAPEVVDGPKSN
jgi:hypothetical protein